MDRCPIEIWNQIFTLACTDNGFTGRSLSLVLRYIHETSKSAKLQSLSVTKPQQIFGLARLIADTPPEYRQVRYLFIASPDIRDGESDEGDMYKAEGEDGATGAVDGGDAAPYSTQPKRDIVYENLVIAKRPNGIKDFERYWLSRIEGGEGVWMVPPLPSITDS